MKLIKINLLVPGIEVGECGPQSIRLRPSLIFTEYHADIFLDAMRCTLQDMSES